MNDKELIEQIADDMAVQAKTVIGRSGLLSHTKAVAIGKAVRMVIIEELTDALYVEALKKAAREATNAT